jgi:predicted porin
MKTKILTGLLATCFALPVLGQSSVTIYGIADAGIQYSKNGGNDRSVKLVNGIAEGSRLGFKGNEDLGNGFRAVFNLEARVEIDTGAQQNGNVSTNQGLFLTRGMDALGPRLLPVIRGVLQPSINVNPTNALFDRISLVGLVTPIGGFILGRQFTPAYEVFAGAETFEIGTGGNWGNIIGGLGGTVITAGAAIRSNEAIQYRAVLGPHNVAYMRGFNGSGVFNQDNRFDGINYIYKANGFDAGIGYNRGTDQNNNTSLISRVVGGSFTTGNFKFFAGFQGSQNSNSTLVPTFIAGFDAQIAPTLVPLGAATATALRNIFVTNLRRNFILNQRSASLGLQYKIGSGRIVTSISHSDDRTDANGDMTQFAIGYNYFLSKRTDIYTVAAHINNKGPAQNAIGVASASGGFTASPGQNSRGLQVGIRHKF